MSKKPARKPAKYPPGTVRSLEVLPAGWAHHPKAEDAITPTFEMWAGVPVRRDSTFAELLGWPGPCHGRMNISIRHTDGTESVPVIDERNVIVGFTRQKPETTGPPVLTSGGWISTGFYDHDMVWVDNHGNFRKGIPWLERKRLICANIVRKVHSKATRRPYLARLSG